MLKKKVSYFMAILLCTAIADVQWTADKVILYVDHQKGIHWSYDLRGFE